MKENSLLRREAQELLEGQWMMAALIYLVYAVIMGAAGTFTLAAIALLPLVYSLRVQFLEANRGKKLDISDLFDGFSEYFRIMGTLLLMYIYMVLWTLLLIIPGIVKYYSYILTPYILKDYPELSYDDAINQSMSMMNGFKSKMFMLDLSFLGWAILCILTLGIGFLWLMPYVHTSHALFYEDLKEYYEALNHNQEQ
jgi:uncharacterized membrane protein